jgi:hypothetical protein
MILTERIAAFVELETFLRQFIFQNKNNSLAKINEKYYNNFSNTIQNVQHSNAFFTHQNVLNAIAGINIFLDKKHLTEWISRYNMTDDFSPKIVGLVLAGNIPLVGFHDVLSVLISGHIAKTKLSSKDDKLMFLIHEILVEIEPRFAQRWIITGGKLNDFAAIIATGSNNSGRYFEYYFGRYPHIFRNNRNAVAVLSGNESDEELSALADDVFMFFGLGCRNVSKIYIPQDYHIESLFNAFNKYSNLFNHHKYANNYEYQRTILLLNKIPHLDTGFLLIRESNAIASPLAVLHYQTYKNIQALKEYLNSEKDAIQCIVSGIADFPEAIAPGKAQFPNAWDYADNVDTIQFLNHL